MIENSGENSRVQNYFFTQYARWLFLQLAGINAINHKPTRILFATGCVEREKYSERNSTTCGMTSACQARFAIIR